MAKKGREDKDGGKYPHLRAFLTREFGSLRRFAKEGGVSASLLVQVLKGRPGYDRTQNRSRIEETIRGLRPGTDLTGIWQRPSRITPEDAALRRRLRQSRIRRAIEIEEELHL